MEWTEKNPAWRRKGDCDKVKLNVLRAKTTIPLAWIARRLAMGHRLISLGCSIVPERIET